MYAISLYWWMPASQLIFKHLWHAIARSRSKSKPIPRMYELIRVDEKKHFQKINTKASCLTGFLGLDLASVPSGVSNDVLASGHVISIPITDYF